MAGLADFRAQHPEYNDMPDAQLGDALYKKFYSDIPRDQFNQKMGLGGAPQAPQATPQKDSGIMSQVGNAVAAPFKAAGEGLANIQNEALKEGRENTAAIAGDFTAPVRGPEKKGIKQLISGQKEYQKPGLMDYAARAGQTALDIAQRPFIYPHAISKETIGAASEARGGPKAENVANATDILIPFGPKMARSLPALAGKVSHGAAEALAPFEKIFSPTTVGPKAGAAERTIRRATGESNLQHEKAASSLLEHNKLVGNLPVAEQRQMISDIEKGRPQANPKLQPAADAIRKVYDGWKAKVQKTLPANAIPNFINDYYTHIWKDKPSVVGQKLGQVYKQGSGRTFKQRTIPTIEDGLRAGLTPKFENPIEATLAYSQNMARYVATHDMLGELKTQGYAKWYSPGSKNIPQGWVELDGIMTKKTAPVTTGVVKSMGAEAAYNDIAKLGKKYGLAGKGSDRHRALARIADEHFGELSPQSQRFLLGRRVADMETGEMNEIGGQGGSQNYGNHNIHGGHIGQLEQEIDDERADKFLNQKPSTGGRPIHLYAPPEVARVFNNFISKGFEQGDTGPIWEMARRVSNGMTMMKLGLSTYHLGTMANEAMISDYARAFRAASQGNFKTALKAGLTAPAAPVKSYLRGLKMQRELLDKRMPDAMSRKVNDAFVRSGQTLNMDPFYRTRSSGSFYNAFHKGTFKREVADAAKKIYSGGAWDKVKGTADLVANVIQSTAAPLFEHYIPSVKRGAFASEMEDFLRANPNAPQDVIDKEAVKIADSIDNRFGELNNDNLFWSRKMKQAAQIALLAPTWDLGTVREIAGGLKDIGKIPGEGMSRRTAYVAGLAFNTALMSSVYQYLKTGKGPGSALDLMAPKTGGTDASSGAPERAVTPGYQKDVYAFGYDFPNHVLEEGANKLNPGLSSAAGLLANKDYRGLPIYNPQGTAGEKTSQIGGYTLEQLLPISVGQMTQGTKKGSNISEGERAFSIRPAPSYMTDSERVQDYQKRRDTRAWKTKERADARQKAQQQ